MYYNFQQNNIINAWYWEDSSDYGKYVKVTGDDRTQKYTSVKRELQWLSPSQLEMHKDNERMEGKRDIYKLLSFFKTKEKLGQSLWLPGS